MRRSPFMVLAVPVAAHACSGPHVQERILEARRVAAVGLSLCLVFFALTLVWSWRRKVPNWLPVATGLLAGINPYWFDHGQGGDCGATIMTASPFVASVSGLVAMLVWAKYRERPQK